MSLRRGQQLTHKITSPELREYYTNMVNSQEVTKEVSQEVKLERDIKSDPTYRYMRKESTSAVTAQSKCYSCPIKMFCKAMVAHRYVINQRDCSKARKYVALRLIEKYGEGYKGKLAELLQK